MTEPPDGVEHDYARADIGEQLRDIAGGLHRDIPLPILAAGGVALLAVLWVVVKAVRFLFSIGKWVALASAAAAAVAYFIEQQRGSDDDEEDD